VAAGPGRGMAALPCLHPSRGGCQETVGQSRAGQGRAGRGGGVAPYRGSERPRGGRWGAAGAQQRRSLGIFNRKGTGAAPRQEAAPVSCHTWPRPGAGRE